VSAFARILVGIDGTDWGFEALRQALLVSPAETSVVQAVTALDTAPAIHAGMNATHLAEMLTQEAAEARDAAEKIMGSRPGSARVVRGKAGPCAAAGARRARRHARCFRRQTEQPVLGDHAR
jgi:hypothetical protein